MTRKLTVLFFGLIWKIIENCSRVTSLTDFCFLASFWRYFILYDMQRTNFLRHTCIITYFKMLYNFVTIINSLKMNDEHEICPQQHPCRFSTADCFSRKLNHYAS
jgi:hypothetical protein